MTKATHGHLRLATAGLGEITAQAAPAGQSLHAGEQGFFALRPEQVRVVGHLESADLKNRFAGHVRELLYLGDVTHYMVGLDGTPGEAADVVVEAMMPNAAPGRARFHEVGDAVAVCWRHDAGIFLRE